MDERKRTIRDLTERRGEYLRTLNELYESLGRRTSSAIDSTKIEDQGGFELSDAFRDYVVEYRRLCRDYAEAEENAKAIREDLAKIKDIKEKEQHVSAQTNELRKNLPELWASLGEAVLREEELPEEIEAQRLRLEELTRQVENTESQLLDLQKGESSGFFSVIGRSVKSVMVKSSITSRTAQIRRIYVEVGKTLELSSFVQESESTTVGEAFSKLEFQNRELRSLESELSKLVEQRAQAQERLSMLDVGRFPSLSAGDWEERKKVNLDKIKDLCRSFGERITDESAKLGSLASEPAFIQEMDQIEKLHESIRGADKQIEKIEASIRIDTLVSELKKYKDSIKAHEARIKEERGAIESLKKSIMETEKKIDELSKY